ncbi:Fpg/Nei family DNA glycosylase [Serinibacter salmoneus]|uniref:DNA-(apurinic or apyrimidinic site) lyase n=1 Tax=Serinibacter salmoneus TaxID=556530 RepID=A0A2A9D0I7_9MICO|nr:DNA-formamidopyrimidine glycosylase family protein [Serinibacter salmoneus]PFG19350.1 endonuclease-8 [Serinibacter salmoneus]
MPEGDVVLRVARRLTLALSGEEITRSDLRWPSIAGVDLVGLHSLGTVTYGKHLLTRLSDGRTLHSHLRMEGMWRIERTGSPAARGDRGDVRALLATRHWTCLGMRLGMMDLLATRDEPRLLADLGPDVLAPRFPEHADRVRQRARSDPDRAIGAVLLDQRVLAGLGTIYMAETLFRHRISPWRPVQEVPDVVDLATTARHLMQSAADATAAPGEPGARPVAVHGRLGLPCRRCGERIRVGEVGAAPMQRPAFYCPRCQPS